MLQKKGSAIEDDYRARLSQLSEDDSLLPKWAEAVVFVRRQGREGGHTVRTAYPSEGLSEELLDDICATAITKPLPGTCMSSARFMFRVRDKLVAGGGEALMDAEDEFVGYAVTKTTVFFNCYVLYRQQVLQDGSSSAGRLMRQAVVLVSRWPFPQLAATILAKIDEAFYWNSSAEDLAQPSSPSMDSQPVNVAAERTEVEQGGLGWHVSVSAVDNVLLVAFGQIEVWPAADPGATVYLHFFGDMMQFSVASDVLTTFGSNLSFGPALASVNLVALLGPLGLLQHVWALWELLVSGQDVVVLASTPAQCCEIVLAVASLMLPVLRIADLRPYIDANDSDVGVLALTAQLKYEALMRDELSALGSSSVKRKSMLVGIADASLLGNFECFGAVLMVAPPPQNSAQSPGHDPDASFKGLRTKNAALLHVFAKPTAERKKAHIGIKLKKRGTLAASAAKSSNSFVDFFQSWTAGGSVRSALVCRQEPTAFSIKKLLGQIKEMAPKDRHVLGDKLLRDNLRELTVSFHRPEEGGEGDSVEASAMRDSLIERAELAEERVKGAEVRSSLKDTALFSLEDVGGSLLGMPQWVSANVATVTLWTLYLSVILVLFACGVPLVLLLAGWLMAPVPDKATPAFEALLRGFAPSWLLLDTPRFVCELS